MVAADAGEQRAHGRRRGPTGTEGGEITTGFGSCCKVLETSSPRKREWHWRMLGGGCHELVSIEPSLATGGWKQGGCVGRSGTSPGGRWARLAVGEGDKWSGVGCVLKVGSAVGARAGNLPWRTTQPVAGASVRTEFPFQRKRSKVSFSAGGRAGPECRGRRCARPRSGSQRLPAGARVEASGGSGRPRRLGKSFRPE